MNNNLGSVNKNGGAEGDNITTHTPDIQENKKGCGTKIYGIRGKHCGWCDGNLYTCSECEDNQTAQDIIKESNEELTEQEQTDLNISKITRDLK